MKELGITRTNQGKHSLSKRARGLALGAYLLLTTSKDVQSGRGSKAIVGEVRKDKRGEEKQAPRSVENVAVNKEVLKIGKVATEASYTRIANEDVIELKFEDGSSLKAVLEADSALRVYVEPNLLEETKIEYFKYLVIGREMAAVEIIRGCGTGGKGYGRPNYRSDKLIFQSSAGDCLVLEVRPGSIKRVEYKEA